MQVPGDKKPSEMPNVYLNFIAEHCLELKQPYFIPTMAGQNVQKDITRISYGTPRV